MASFCKLGTISLGKKLKPALVLKRPLPRGMTHYLKTEKMICAKQSNSSWQILPTVSRASVRWGKRNANLSSGCLCKTCSLGHHAGRVTLRPHLRFTSITESSWKQKCFFSRDPRGKEMQTPSSSTSQTILSLCKRKGPALAACNSLLSTGFSFLWQGWWKPKLNLGPNFKRNLNLLSKQ